MLGMVILAAWSCEERYHPEIEQKYQEILVVDGVISNQPGPYTVKLSVSSSVETPEVIPVSGYRVEISDNLGNSERLNETEPGTYVTSPDGIQGITGRKYRLELTSPAGETYQSGFEELRAPVPIDSLYAEIDYQNIEDFPYNLPGYQFYLDVLELQDDSLNFLWQLDETYKYQADHLIFYTYDGILHEVTNTDTLHTCYKTQPVFDIFLFSTKGLVTPAIRHFPLHFVGTDNRRLDLRYSLLARQYNISEKAYAYWKSIRELSSGGGDLYSKQPFQVRGNIHKLNDDRIPVYGYFMAAGVTEKRIFTNRPKPPIKMYFSRCSLVDADFMNFGMMFYGPPPPPDNPNLITQTPKGRRAWPVPSCVDCRVKGGQLEKPVFWID